ncbi:hypothetical protein DPMN_104076 [Dreissena polymorpha]|uniref:Uncharacterized protein n=1 Tax=Dreissena polymorpha TaxID=45954 RepID=A0A9D4H734_DREPO|nr:hypothetical protein DPMN_104076 [Dreissena polymorpha]
MFGGRVGKDDGGRRLDFAILLGRLFLLICCRAQQEDRGRCVVSGGSRGWRLGAGPCAGAGGRKPALRGCAGAGAGCSALWELGRDKAYHD